MITVGFCFFSKLMDYKLLDLFHIKIYYVFLSLSKIPNMFDVFRPLNINI